MKANEFIKKFGLEYAKHILLEESVILVDLDYENLKRLIESHELADYYGGLDEAKIYVPDGYKSERLKQAIADVESCQ